MIAVLFLDDDRELSETCKAFLECWGDFKVDVMATVKDAMGAVKATSYDAIISDYQLPDGDGLEFLRMVRESDKYTPFIMLTGSGREELAAEAYVLGASHYLRKSYDLESQLIEIQYVLRLSVRVREEEEDLHLARLQAKLASGLSGIMSWSYDEEKNAFRFDEAFADLCSDGSFEAGRSVPVDEYIRGYVHPEDMEMVASWIEKSCRYLEPGEFLQMDHRIVRKDGEVRHILARAAYFKGGDGRKAKVYGVNWDITGLKLPQERKRKAGAAASFEKGGQRKELGRRKGRLRSPQRVQSFTEVSRVGPAPA